MKYRLLDNHVISEAEYRAKQTDISDFFDARETGKATRDFALAGEKMLSATLPAPPPNAPAPIGKGLPLSILIREIYTGEFPHGGIFNSGGDIAVVSGVKNYDVFNASSRALNFMVQNVDSHTRLRRPSPFTDGTSLVAYSPAIMTDSLTVGFELAVADFPQALFNSLSSAFTTVAGLPLLMPYSGYLLAAGELFKLVGNAGHALFDGVKFSITEAIDFDIWGSAPAVAGFRIISTNNDLSGYTYSDAGGLVDAKGNKYSGDDPYVVISLDGAQRDNLKSFAPTVASAAILGRFFSVTDGSQVAIDSLVQGLQFVSDSKYRDQALHIKTQLADPNTDTATKAELQKQLDAALKNIVSDAMKPP
jgi:hypothetical protein